MAELEKKTRFMKALMELRELVMSGALEPGQRLSEVAVSQQLGISRTPLREAMARLVEEGFLERIPTGGCRVRQVTVADVVDSIEVRGTIEGMAVRLAAERGAAPGALRVCHDLVDRIDEALGASEAETDFEAYADLNAAFHEALGSLAGSETVRREHARVSQLPLAGPSAFLQGQIAVPEIRRSLFVAQRQHRALIEAIEAREGTRAEALAREHARLARANLDYLMQRDPDEAGAVPGLAMVSAG